MTVSCFRARHFSPLLTVLALMLTAERLRADGAGDNLAGQVRPIPPPGVPVAAEARAALSSEVARLAIGIEALRGQLADKAALAYLPDVEIFHKSVDWALRYDGFHDAKQADWAKEQLKTGFERLAWLGKGETPWLDQTGLVPRGYVSRIDGSVQPFGLVVPASFQAKLPHRWRLDTWFHGRGEKLTELDFLQQRMTQPGEFTPQDTIVLHPYGRYCNGQRFAGETDFFEALEVVKRDYRIDADRIVVRGFSLGGAACWHIATHHAWQWCAANPGAGFSETEEFLREFQGEKLEPFPWERQLWNLYDSTSVAGNLLNCPTVAYSGELDRQKQAADLMARRIGDGDSGLSLRHVVGPGTAHSYEKGAKIEVAAAIDGIAERGRTRVPRQIRFQTFTLKTHRAAWVEIDALGEHWQPSAIVASIESGGFRVGVKNVTAFTLRFDPGTFPEEVGSRFGVTVNDDPFGEGGEDLPAIEGEVYRPSDGSLRMSFARRGDGRWGGARTCPAACARSTDCRGRSTTPSWIHSSSCVRPASRRMKRRQLGRRRKWSGRSANGDVNSGARSG